MTLAQQYGQEFITTRCRACTSATQDNCDECAGTGRVIERRKHKTIFQKFISNLKGVRRWSN